MSSSSSSSTSSPSTSSSANATAQSFLDYINASPSPFHAVAQAAALLESSGFERVSEKSEWQLRAGGRYFIVRNHTSLVSFVVGSKYQPGNGFNIIGTHSDSPCLKLKPNSKVAKHGFLEVGVQTYGGGIWHTWFDRDLQVAGRVIVQNGDVFEEKLVRINRPLLRIPTLAIHLQRDVNEAFKFNTETQLLPIIATAVKDQIVRKEAAPLASGYPHAVHHPVLLELIATQIGCSVEQIKDLELCLAEYQPAGFGGAYDEFIFSPRLDNLLSSYCAIEAIRTVASNEEIISDETNILVAAMFDNEEVGSESVNGAGSNILEHILKRIFLAFCPGEPRDLFEVSARRSFLVSADMAHACHPNYAEKHEDRHAPAIHSGVVIKNNANQRYATTSVSGFFMRELARRNKIPIQEFVVRNDSLCGSTIGPMLSARGFRTVDVGAPQLSMHSAREMMGTDDVSHTLELFKAFYAQFTKLDKSVDIDC